MHCVAVTPSLAHWLLVLRGITAETDIVSRRLQKPLHLTKSLHSRIFDLHLGRGLYRRLSSVPSGVRSVVQLYLCDSALSHASIRVRPRPGSDPPYNLDHNPTMTSQSSRQFRARRWKKPTRWNSVVTLITDRGIACADGQKDEIRARSV